MGSLKELVIPPPKIDLQYSLHFWSYRVMYGCIQVPVCVWWQLGKKRFYIRPSQRVSEINLFWVFFAEYYITCTSAMKCLVAWNNITCMLNYHDNVGMEYYQHIIYIYICFVWCAAICYCFNHYSVHCRNEIFNLAF